MIDPVVVGERIRRAREHLNWNKNELARALGTSWQHVDRWESGRVAPTLSSLGRIARTLGVRAEFLLGLTEERVQPSAIEIFLSEHAPADLSTDEELWLRQAPMEDASAESYARLLDELRRSRPAAKSRTRKKVSRASIKREQARRAAKTGKKK